MNYFGDKTPKTVVLTTEAHKLHLAFAVATAAVIHLMQPVKLAADGSITPALAADGAHLIIGHSFHDAPQNMIGGGEQTVVMRGHITHRAQAGTGGVIPGPVKWASYDTTNKVNVYVQATDVATTQGHALEAGAAGAEIDIVLL